MYVFLFWIVVAIIAGALAHAVVPGEGRGGWLGDLVVGLVGAFIGGFVCSALMGYNPAGAGHWVATTIVAFIGAVILLFIMRALTGRRAL